MNFLDGYKTYISGTLLVLLSLVMLGDAVGIEVLSGDHTLQQAIQTFASGLAVIGFRRKLEKG